MLKEHSTASKIAVAIIDVLLLFGAFWGAYIWRSHLGNIGPAERYYNLLFYSIPLILLFLYRQGLYGEIRFDSVKRIAWKTVLSLLSVGIASSAILYLTHAGYFSRLLFGYYFLIASGLLLAEKTGLKSLQNYWRSKGYNLRNVVIIGAGEKLQHLLDYIQARPEWGLRVLKVCPFDQTTLDEVRGLLEREPVDEVYLAFSRSAQGVCDTGPLLSLAERFGKVIKVAVNLDEELSVSRIDFCKLGDMPALAFYSKTLDPDQLLLKRVIDIAGSAVGLAITATLFPFIALAIKLDSPGPVLFGHSRVGLNGRRFKLYKFRSMYRDAEARKGELLKENEHEGPIFKLKDDPRVTRVGRFLRCTSLDELPQFWNVLKGEMSLVGTRPPTPDEVEQYKAWHYRRISIRPGITGLWQVSGRNRIHDFDEIVSLDLQYISQWSVLLDMKILLKTLLIFWQPGKSGAR
jgi:exopolysaccharide biosynthesis polyprenyl glycosylphosphotransferase